MSVSGRTAPMVLVVRGGWEGHVPIEATGLFLDQLTRDGYHVEVSDSLDVYANQDLMRRVDLVLQCWTMGEITTQQIEGLRSAVADGTGLAGWHGGIVDSFRSCSAYLQLTGGQFVAHPGGFVDYQVAISAESASHPVVAGIDSFEVRSEQYWVLTDPAIDVLATTTIPARDDDPWHQAVTCPAVWTRAWGKGKVFVTTVGHQAEVRDLEVPEVHQIIDRGMRWACR
jgi:type 1 glutamine amidotransferase